MNRQRVLVALISLFAANDNISTAFIPNARQQLLPHATNANDAIDSTSSPILCTNTKPTTRLFLGPSSSEPSNKNSRDSTTELRAATGITLSSSAPSVAAPSPVERSGVGVLFLNLGGPTTGDDVEEFLFNLFADPDIIRLPGPLAPLQNIIASFIAKRRAPKSRAAYESIGGGSPILKYTNAQAELLSESFEEKYGMPIKTYVGMRYWKPYTEEALEAIRKDKIKALVILPLYPQFSISTSGSSLRVLQEDFSKEAASYGDMVHTVVPSWYDRPGYIQAMSNLIQTELESFTDSEKESAKAKAPALTSMHVLFSAHGVPKSYIEAGDPYQKQMEKCVEGIKTKLYETYSADDLTIHLSYQSRVGPIEWLRPYTDDVLPQLGESGVQNLVVVPISFVSEHIETLEEIDIEYRELAEESGVSNWRRCPAPNTDETFIQDMADMVYEALHEPAQTVTETCIANNIEGIDLTALDDSVAVSAGGVGGVGADGVDRKSVV